MNTLLRPQLLTQMRPGPGRLLAAHRASTQPENARSQPGASSIHLLRRQLQIYLTGALNQLLDLGVPTTCGHAVSGKARLFAPTLSFSQIIVHDSSMPGVIPDSHYDSKLLRKKLNRIVNPLKVFRGVARDGQHGSLHDPQVSQCREFTPVQEAILRCCRWRGKGAISTCTCGDQPPRRLSSLRPSKSPDPPARFARRP